MRRKRRAPLVFLAVLFVCAGCDHVSKQVALSALSEARSVSVAGDTVRLELASNPGAFLSFGAQLPETVRSVFFLGFVPLLIVVFCAYFLRGGGASLPALVGLGLVAGGGLANWLDRLLHDGAVTDFIVLGVGPLRTGVFNVADVAVIAGVGALVLATRSHRPDALGRAS